MISKEAKNRIIDNYKRNKINNKKIKKEKEKLKMKNII